MSCRAHRRSLSVKSGWTSQSPEVYRNLVSSPHTLNQNYEARAGASVKAAVVMLGVPTDRTGGDPLARPKLTFQPLDVACQLKSPQPKHKLVLR